MSDHEWMLWNHKPPPSSGPQREEVFGFVMVKDTRVMTGVLRRVDDTRWEVVYRVNGALYSAQTLASRELAEQHLARHKDALN
jgi:hypothetical protein